MPNRLLQASSIGPLSSYSDGTTNGASHAAFVRVAERLASGAPGRKSSTAAAPLVPSISNSRPQLIDDELVAGLVAIAEPVVANRPSGASFEARQTWEGVITAVRGEEFVSLMDDRTNPSSPDEEIVFDFGEVSPSERSLITVGAVFYLFIGVERATGGQQKNVSIIKFRRLPIWTRSALNRVESRANEVRDILGIE